MTWSTYRNTRFPLLPAPHWVSGRFYGFGYANGTHNTSNSRRWLSAPILIPNYTTLASIGCEVSTGAASSYMRLAIYSNCADMLYPDERLMQTSKLDISSTAYVSEASSLKLRPGWYWLSGCWDVGASVRIVNCANFVPAFIGPSILSIATSNIGAVLDVGNSSATINADIVNNGFPLHFPRSSVTGYAITFQGNDMMAIRLEVA